MEKVKKELEIDSRAAYRINEFGENDLIRALRLHRYEIASSILKKGVVTPELINQKDIAETLLFEKSNI